MLYSNRKEDVVKKLVRLIIGVMCSILLIPWMAATQPQGLSFEVATIKTAEPLTPATMASALASGKLRMGLSVTGSRVEIGYVSLADMIPIAFRVKPHQVSGPEWMRSQRFDIIAKVPEGTNKDQVPEMLQTFLEERFHLKIHREQREHSVYALVVGKDGPKFKESTPEDEAVPPENPNALTLGAGGSQVRINPGRGGATVVMPEGGTTKVSMGPEGLMRMEMSKMTMNGFAESLTAFVDRPVVDMTELKGNYKLTVDLSMETLLNVARAAGVGVPAFGPRGAPAGPADASDPGGGSIFASVQQLGLRLESRKAPVEFVVIDSVDKMPTEN